MYGAFGKNSNHVPANANDLILFLWCNRYNTKSVDIPSGIMARNKFQNKKK
jgi:hypothetical protein